MPLTAEQVRSIERMEIISPARVAIMRAMSPAEKFAISNRMWCAVRSAVLDEVRNEHPEWSQETVHREMATRMLDGTVERTYDVRWRVDESDGRVLIDVVKKIP